MIGKVKSFLKDQSKIFFSCSFIVICTFLFFVFVLKKPFLLNNDQWFQYNIFYKEWIRLIIEFIKGNGLPMYSWNMYLGTDFYSAMGYYCTGDIFLPLLLLFRNNVELGLLIETILCVYIAAVTMNIFLEKYHVENENIRVFISIIYAIGGQASQFVGNYMFYRFYAFMPLLFIGLLNYFKDKKVKTFIVATAILLLQSYYLMFPTLIFLFMFSLMLEIKMKKDIKIIFKDFFILLGCLIVGFMISAIITLPSIMYLLNNPRVGANDGGLLWQRNTYAGLYMSITSYIPWMLDNIFKTTNGGHDNFYTLFVTIIPLLSSLVFIFDKENKEELVLFLIITIFMCIKPLSSFMHGFSSPSLRWIFLFQFYMLVLSAKGLAKGEDKKIYLFFVLYMFGFIVQLYILNKRNYIDYWNVLEHVKIIELALVLDVVIFITFRLRKKLAFVLAIFEILSFQSYDFYVKTVIGGTFVSNDAINAEAVAYFQSLDEDQYRYYHDYNNNLPPEILNQNKSLDYGFMATSTYNSMYDYGTETFSHLSGSTIVSDLMNMGWVLECSDPYANTMLGVKYYIVYKDKELPKELNFEYAYNLDYLEVYRNLDYKGFGYTASNLKYTKDFDTTKDFYDYILVDDDSYDLDKYQNIKETKLNIIERYNNHFLADINLEEDNILLIPIPNNKGWRVKVNDEFVNTISVNGGFIGIELNEGYNKIEMNFTSPYFEGGGGYYLYVA